MASQNNQGGFSSKPLVSILVPMYNSAATIRETVESCVNQVYGNVEVIIVDDSSKDDSFAVAETLATEYPNVQVYKQPNSGACRARNLAFEHSKGEYIQYLDADDILSLDKISNQMDLALANGKNDMFFCRWQRFTGSPAAAIPNNLFIYKNYAVASDWLVDSWFGRGALQTACWLLSRDLVLAAGEWNETLLKNQDGEFFSRAILKAGKMYYEPRGIVFYRDSGITSISGNKNYPTSESTFRSYKLYREHIKNINNPALQEASLVNFSQFVRYYYPHHKQLLDEAKSIVLANGYKNFPLSDAWPFAKVYKILGFKTGVKLEYLAKTIISKLK